MANRTHCPKTRGKTFNCQIEFWSHLFQHLSTNGSLVSRLPAETKSCFCKHVANLSIGFYDPGTNKQWPPKPLVDLVTPKQNWTKNEWHGKLSSRPTLTIIERAGRLACKVQLSSRGLRTKTPEVHVKKLFSLYNVTVWIQGAAQRHVATLQISVGALWQDSTPCSRSSTSSSRLAAGNENSASEWLNICIASATWTESLTWMMKKTS